MLPPIDAADDRRRLEWREKIMLAPRETQEIKTRHESNADSVVAGVWLSLYALAILSAIGSPILIAAAAQVW